MPKLPREIASAPCSKERLYKGTSFDYLNYAFRRVPGNPAPGILDSPLKSLAAHNLDNYANVMGNGYVHK